MLEKYGAQEAGLGGSQLQTRDIKQPTVRENLERQIAFHEGRVVKLRETLEKMDKTGLLDMRIDEIREAMNY